MAKGRHPHKAVAAAIQFALSRGWSVQEASGHNWCILYCPLRTREGHKVGVFCTPRDGDNHARHIRRAIIKCHHTSTHSEAGHPHD